MTRGLRAALVGCLCAALLLLLAASVTWARVAYPARSRTASGHAFVGALAAWGLIALAGVVAVPAARHRARVLVGLALTASGATAAAQVLDALRDFDTRAYAATRGAGVDVLVKWPVHQAFWPYVALLGGVLLAATGVLVALRGPGWVALGAKYDAPATRAVSEADLWSAMDRGEDPTA